MRRAGGGKIPVMPNYLLSMSDHKVILRNYEGYVASYEEPTDYLPSDAAKFKGEKSPSRSGRYIMVCWMVSRCSSSRKASMKSMIVMAFNTV